MAFKGEPVQMNVGGAISPVQIWAGSQGFQGVPILCINQDMTNAVSIGYQSNIGIGGANTVQLGPQSAMPLDGSRTIYAIAPPNTAPLQVIPGASNFFQRLTSLTLPVGATSGPRIVLNGLDATITGYNSAGNPTYIIDPNGIFFYQG
jgi:hypothetical protein